MEFLSDAMMNKRSDISMKLMELIQDENDEIKAIDRYILEYNSVNWDIQYLMYHQHEIHDKYKKDEEDFKYEFN